MNDPKRSTRRPLDAVALARVIQRLQRAERAPWLHGEVARRMVERLPIVELRPECVIDWSAFLGASTAALQGAYPSAEYWAVEADAGRRDLTAKSIARPWWSPQRWAGPGPRAVLAQDVPAGQGQLLWSNMALHGAIDPQQVLRERHRCTAVDGFLMFSTLGPATLVELTELYRVFGWPSPLAPLVDMHDLGDMLVQAGFADPVMDQEIITLTWAGPEALLQELRSLGGNLALDRLPGLRGRRWRTQLLAALQGLAGADGRIGLSFEIVYGHAFRPPPRPRVEAETAVPLADLRAMVRAGRRTG